MKHFASFLFFVAAAGTGYATPVFSVSGCLPAMQSASPISVSQSGCLGTAGGMFADLDFTRFEVSANAPGSVGGFSVANILASLDFSVTVSGGTGIGFLEGYFDVISGMNFTPCGGVNPCQASAIMTFGRPLQTISVGAGPGHPPRVPFVFQIVFGQPQSFQWSIQARAENFLPSVTQAAFIEASLGPFTVLDSAGNVVSGASVTGSNGLIYPISGTVPEPASLLLTGAALLTIGALRRKYVSH